MAIEWSLCALGSIVSDYSQELNGIIGFWMIYTKTIWYNRSLCEYADFSYAFANYAKKGALLNGA